MPFSGKLPNAKSSDVYMILQAPKSCRIPYTCIISTLNDEFRRYASTANANAKIYFVILLAGLDVDSFAKEVRTLSGKLIIPTTDSRIIQMIVWADNYHYENRCNIR